MEDVCGHDEDIQKDFEDDQKDDLDKFIQRLSDLGGKAGNKTLRDALGWSEKTDRYWDAHGRALDQGLIMPGRGKGGSVALVISAKETDTSVVEEISEGKDKKGIVSKELDLYDPCYQVINNVWAKAENYDDYIVSITGLRGRAYTGGKWTRPDIAVLGVKAYPYLPQRYFEIVTFEVKPAGQTNVEGVFEALSHQQFANRSYVIYHVPDLGTNDFNEKFSDAQRIITTARKYGIGIISATNISDWETWDILLGPERVLPDPEQANRFIATGFSSEIHEKVIKWSK